MKYPRFWIREKHVMNLFKVEKVAICGSDIALYLWNEVAKVIATVPFIPGKFWPFLVISGQFWLFLVQTLPCINME